MSRSQYSFKDIVVYIAVVIALYYIFLKVPVRWAENLTAFSCSVFLNFFGFASSYGVDTTGVYLSLISGARPVYVYIIRECTAIHVLGIILGLVAPLKSVGALRKAFAFTLGAFSIYLMNVIRIALTLILSGYDIPPLSWFITNPTVSTYHYPISFIFGVVGIVITVLLMDRYCLPELGDLLASIPDILSSSLR